MPPRIDLCLSVFPWAPFRSNEAAVKLHTLLDLRGNIPSFIFISDGKLHDVNILDQLVPEPGAIYVMDRGYIDFDRLSRFHEAGSFFVIRAKTNLKAERRAACCRQDRGVRTTDSSVDRFFRRHGVTFKKNSARGRAGAARRSRGAAMLEGRAGEP